MSILRSLILLANIGVLTGLAAGFTGCTAAKPTDPKATAARAKYMVEDEPAGAISIAEAKKLAANSEIVLVGKIGVQGQKAFEPGKAMFLISEALPGAAAHTHKDGEDVSDCPFCKRAQNDRVAMVQLVDESGEVLPVDGPALGLKEGQELVVQGHGQADPLDMFIVSAKALYLRPE